MTDSELLTLAAKAAGIKGRSTSLGFITMEAGYDADPLYWNPLTDDADALRLAVKLHIVTLFPILGTKRPTCGAGRVGSSVPACFEPYKPDPYAATRRAIVRAAAEIGRTK